MASAAKLYSPEVLALATSLANFPMTPELQHLGTARSATCGSVIELGVGIDTAGRIAQIGVKAQACAVGQAAAALFLQAAQGRNRQAIAEAEAAISLWLGSAADLPDWPGIATLSAARDYPARHGAILLAWRAALAALPTG